MSTLTSLNFPSFEVLFSICTIERQLGLLIRAAKRDIARPGFISALAKKIMKALEGSNIDLTQNDPTTLGIVLPPEVIQEMKNKNIHNLLQFMRYVVGLKWEELKPKQFKQQFTNLFMLGPGVYDESKIDSGIIWKVLLQFALPAKFAAPRWIHFSNSPHKELCPDCAGNGKKVFSSCSKCEFLQNVLAAWFRSNAYRSNGKLSIERLRSADARVAQTWANRDAAEYHANAKRYEAEKEKGPRARLIAVEKALIKRYVYVRDGRGELKIVNRALVDNETKLDLDQWLEMKGLKRDDVFQPSGILFFGLNSIIGFIERINVKEWYRASQQSVFGADTGAGRTLSGIAQVEGFLRKQVFHHIANDFQLSSAIDDQSTAVGLNLDEKLDLDTPHETLKRHVHAALQEYIKNMEHNIQTASARGHGARIFEPSYTSLGVSVPSQRFGDLNASFPDMEKAERGANLKNHDSLSNGVYPNGFAAPLNKAEPGEPNVYPCCRTSSFFCTCGSNVCQCQTKCGCNPETPCLCNLVRKMHSKWKAAKALKAANSANTTDSASAVATQSKVPQKSATTKNTSQNNAANKKINNNNNNNKFGSAASSSTPFINTNGNRNRERDEEVVADSASSVETQAKVPPNSANKKNNNNNKKMIQPTISFAAKKQDNVVNLVDTDDDEVMVWEKK